MKYRKLNKWERKAERAKRLEEALQGSGLYIFENNTKGDIMLPRPTKSGIRTVLVGKQFQGDSYYLSLVKTNELKLVKELLSPEQEKEQMAIEKKLILDQPDTITNRGKVEHVCTDDDPTLPPLNEQGPGKKPSLPAPVGDTLITEDPMAGIVIID
jgi:hypothetical protein